MNGKACKRVFVDVIMSLFMCDVSPETFLSLPRRQALSRPSGWFMRRLQKSMLSFFPDRDDVAIFLVQ